MNTLLQTPSSWRRLCVAALVAGPACVANVAWAADPPASAPAATAVAPASPINCELKMTQAKFQAIETVKLIMHLTNTGSQPVKMVVWDSPYERGWQGPYMTVLRGETPVNYRGPVTKRGDPTAEDYLTLAPGETKLATIDLSAVFDLRRAATYKVTPQITVHDLVVGDAQVPRPRDKMVRTPLDCPYQLFDVVR